MMAGWRLLLVIAVSGFVGVTAGAMGVNQIISSQTSKDVEAATSMAHLHATTDDLIIIHRVIRLDSQGHVAGLPACQDIIAMKLLIYMYDQRGPVIPILSRVKGDDRYMRINGLKDVREVDKADIGKVELNGKTYEVPLTCQAVIMANRDSGPYRFGLLPVIEGKQIEHLFFAAKPEYDEFVSMVHSSLGGTANWTANR